MKKSIEKEDVYIEGDSSSSEEDENENENFIFVKLNKDKKNRKQLQLGAYDPRRQYLSVSYGLNLRGFCSTKKCPAENKNVWIKKGFGKKNVSEEICKSECPCCLKRINPETVTNLGYVRAIVEFEGMNKDSQQIFTFNDEERNGKFITFGDEDQNMTTWMYLKVDVKEIN